MTHGCQSQLCILTIQSSNKHRTLWRLLIHVSVPFCGKAFSPLLHCWRRMVKPRQISDHSFVVSVVSSCDFHSSNLSQTNFQMPTKRVFMQWLRTSLHMTLQSKNLISYLKRVSCFTSLYSLSWGLPLEINTKEYNLEMGFKTFSSLYVSKSIMMQLFSRRPCSQEPMQKVNFTKCLSTCCTKNSKLVNAN